MGARSRRDLKSSAERASYADAITEQERSMSSVVPVMEHSTSCSMYAVTDFPLGDTAVPDWRGDFLRDDKS